MYNSSLANSVHTYVPYIQSKANALFTCLLCFLSSTMKRKEEDIEPGYKARWGGKG